jgi:tetratricopeptide (TPR) repeat protein
LRSREGKIVVLSVGWGREVHSLSSNYPYNSELSAIALNPNYAYLYVSRGTAKINNDKSSALEDFNQAIRLVPNYSYAYEQRGLIKKEQGKKTEAIKDLQKAIELYHQDNKTDKVNELEIAIANLNLDL